MKNKITGKNLHTTSRDGRRNLGRVRRATADAAPTARHRRKLGSGPEAKTVMVPKECDGGGGGGV